MLLVLIQWPVGGYSPYDQLPSTSPEQNETMDTDPPAAPVLASAVLAGSSNEDVLITWSLSTDDGAGDDDVSHYAVYYADAYDYEGDGYSYLGQAGSGETSFAHTLAGDGDWSNYFCYVQANDTSGNGNWSGQAGKFVRFLEKGKHLASMPLVQEDTTLEVVLQTLAGNFKHVRYYKSSDQNNHWKTYWTFKTYRTLFDIDHRMGFWIDMTKDDHLVVAGLVPEMTQIELGHNWNLVSSPSFIDRTVSDALAGIDWQKVQGWGATPPYHQRQMSASDIMTAGEGYWIWVDLPQVWEVTNLPSEPPYIVCTHPVDGELGVPLNASVSVKFSKEMNTSSVTWTTIPDPAGYYETWSESNTLLEIHRGGLWPENMVITFEITYAEDLGGLSLVPGPAPNPWSFTTGLGAPPHIIMTNPYDGEVDVDVWTDVTIQFSREIVPGTFHWNITLGPDPGGWSESWIQTVVHNDTVILAHANPFLEVAAYCLNIEHAQDLYGRDLTPSPFCLEFSTSSYGVHILSTSPSDGAVGVPLNECVIVVFSEPMDVFTFTWTIFPDPNPGGWSSTWSNGNTTVTLSHSFLFAEATLYMVAVTYAEDLSGNPLIPGPVPNPWSFTTVSIGSYIVQTDPYDGQLGVPLNQSVMVWFSQPMSYVNVSVNPFIGFQPFWLNNTTLELYHPTPFGACQEYEINIDGLDLNGQPLVPGPVPNPFSFTTDCGNPYIVQTDPYDGEINVDPDRNITIWFSEPMDTSTVMWALVPDPGGWMMNWSANETVLFLNHSNLLSQCTMYSVAVIYGEDKDGNPLVPGPVPNPWNFTTSAYPSILWTDPADGELNVPLTASIQIEFSWAMNQSSFNWTIDPDPGGWSVNWVSNSTVVLNHSNPFDPFTTYVFTILYIEDICGMPLLGLPAEITFST